MSCCHLEMVWAHIILAHDDLPRHGSAISIVADCHNHHHRLLSFVRISSDHPIYASLVFCCCCCERRMNAATTWPEPQKCSKPLAMLNDDLVPAQPNRSHVKWKTLSECSRARARTRSLNSQHTPCAHNTSDPFAMGTIARTSRLLPACCCNNTIDPHHYLYPQLLSLHALDIKPQKCLLIAIRHVIRSIILWCSAAM